MVVGARTASSRKRSNRFPIDKGQFGYRQVLVSPESVSFGLDGCLNWVDGARPLVAGVRVGGSPLVGGNFVSRVVVEFALGGGPLHATGDVRHHGRPKVADRGRAAAVRQLIRRNLRCGVDTTWLLFRQLRNGNCRFHVLRRDGRLRRRRDGTPASDTVRALGPHYSVHRPPESRLTPELRIETVSLCLAVTKTVQNSQ